MNLIPKSAMTSFILTFLFGPLGLFYSSPLWAVLLSIAFYFTLPTILVPIGIWLLSWGIGHYCVCTHNENIEAIKQLAKDNQ
ncbi:hypothetical protein QWY97_05390 [Vibrio cortegadensis]|uniref:hypothetical protein n=1 Tax=Vibrio cortegadensis TaxID=1328770 RepID=UPI0021C2D917|nr:hypothetical protein [Vibrio cortegadensis]MDN3696784.1 hypothetical protein [Vibrio cortegadensis]